MMRLLTRIGLWILYIFLKFIEKILDLVIKAYCYSAAIVIRILVIGIILALIMKQTSMVPLLVILLIIFLAVGLFASTVVAIVNEISDRLKKRIS